MNLVYLPNNKIYIEEEIYPRNQCDWQLIHIYKEGMKLGADFPPILVGKESDNKYILIDGVHRYKAWAALKKNPIPVILSQKPKKDWFAEAVEVNVKHGKRLSTQERLTSAIRLQEMKYMDSEIATIIGMSKADMKKFIAERAILSTSTKEALISKAAIGYSSNGKKPTYESQKIFHSANQGLIFSQAIELFRQGFIDKENKEIVFLIQALYDEIEKFLSTLVDRSKVL